MLIALERLREYGFKPKAIVDIGAHDGWFAQMCRQIWADPYILMIEALSEKRDNLIATAAMIGNASFEIAMLGETEARSVAFHVVHGGNPDDPIKVGSSKYPELTPWPQEKRLVAQKTLDQVVAGLDKPIDFIKLDVQGAELDVLAGASQTLANVEMCLLECSLCSYNKGAPLFDEVIAYMKSIGFCVFDILDECRRDGKLLQVDCLFCRQGSALRLEYKDEATEYALLA